MMTMTKYGPKLTNEQIIEVAKELVAYEATKPVRFLTGGRCFDITTGRFVSPGSNVMYHPVYWRFSKETVKKICQWLGCKAVWS